MVTLKPNPCQPAQDSRRLSLSSVRRRLGGVQIPLLRVSTNLHAQHTHTHTHTHTHVMQAQPNNPMCPQLWLSQCRFCVSSPPPESHPPRPTRRFDLPGGCLASRTSLVAPDHIFPRPATASPDSRFRLQTLPARTPTHRLLQPELRQPRECPLILVAHTPACHVESESSRSGLWTESWFQRTSASLVSRSYLMCFDFQPEVAFATLVA